MVERLHFLVLYVGSAAMAAFLAACLSSPRVAMFTCDGGGAEGAQQCELAATLASDAAPGADAAPESAAPATPAPARVTVAAAR